VPRVLPARDERDRWIDPDGSFWRALRYVGRSRSEDVVRDAGQAREIGWALGTFHDLVSDVPPELLADTLEGFHVTPLYLRRYQEVLAKNGGGRGSETARCVRFVDERKGGVHVLEEARAMGRLRPRPIHGDPKVNNVLFDESSGLAVALIDLDTVKPGLVHYDIGDCVRSACNPLGEEAGRWEEVRFEPDLGRALLEGYLSAARRFLSEYDYEYVYDAIRLIAFELGLRFFTDYLEGNVYFRAEREEHNLSRALVQFRLTESIEDQERAIRAIVRDLR
jgi:Ser/Thr protein kinase RdoA (MazF antagonist)